MALRAFESLLWHQGERRLRAGQRRRAARALNGRGVLQRQVTATDDEIDHLVYQLYDLTDEEIAIVEGTGR
jgi:type II restriction/modification system DNA methylase subunit YeeA